MWCWWPLLLLLCCDGGRNNRGFDGRRRFDPRVVGVRSSTTQNLDNIRMNRIRPDGSRRCDDD